MKAVLFVAAGGALGAVTRYGIVRFFDTWKGVQTGFPIAIFIANVVGCLAFGWLMGVIEERSILSDELRMGILAGFLGGLTTFSSFGWNTFELIRDGNAPMAILNVAASVLAGLLAVWGGYALAR